MVDGRFDDARAALESELTFVERLSAFSDYSRCALPSLGVELASVPPSRLGQPTRV